jgi:membrane protease YdiL (CAAX protease family)
MIHFPTVTGEFARFVAPARDRSALWQTGLVVVGFVLAFILGSIIVTALFTAVLGQEFMRQVITPEGLGTTPMAVVFVLSTFVGVLAGAWITVRLVLRRPITSALGAAGAPVLRNGILAAEIMALLAGLGVLYTFVTSDPVPHTPFFSWLAILPLAILLILIQVTTEELIFRGVIQQQLAARFNSPWIWMILPSVIFGALHYQPETLGENAWIACASTAMVGIFAADLTARTGNLGAAIGLHFTNNFFALCILSLDGALSGLSLFVTPFQAGEVAALRPLLLTDLVVICAIYVIYLIVVNRRAQV